VLARESVRGPTKKDSLRQRRAACHPTHHRGRDRMRRLEGGEQGRRRGRGNQRGLKRQPHHSEPRPHGPVEEQASAGTGFQGDKTSVYKAHLADEERAAQENLVVQLTDRALGLLWRAVLDDTFETQMSISD
jgi:hypothetical protein